MPTTLSKTYQAFKANAVLGWKMDGNWAPPLVYLFIALLTPAASVLILVFMYMVILGDSSDTTFIAFIMAGSSVFIFVRMVFQGFGWAVVEDREHYKLLRYIYIAPVPFPVQLFGRSVSKIGISIIGSAMTIIAGYLFLHIPFRVGGIDWGMFIGAFILGLIGCLAMGWILSGVMLLTDRMGWVMVEGVAGILFLLSGTVIPLSVLPDFLASIGKFIPITYWAELWRLALYGKTAAISLPGMATVELWFRLVTLTGSTLVFAFVWNRVVDRIARQWGRIEAETFY